MKQKCCSGIVSIIFFAMVACATTFMPGKAEARLCAAIVYEHANYQGDHQCLQEGSYDLGDLTIGNDIISSIKVRQGNRVIVYQHKNFSGKRASVTRNVRYVGDQWNDSISSIVVE